MVSLVGIVNCTPDSFSDGTGEISPITLCGRAEKLIEDGAHVIDIGGDSTRPGSICVGPTEEWRRIAPLVREFAGRLPCSVDTHHIETAKRALGEGVAFINDISGSLESAMLELVRQYNARYMVMFNPHRRAHLFGAGLTVSSAVATVRAWILDTLQTVESAGISPSRVVIDPGMGAFLSDDPAVSWQVIDQSGDLPSSTGGLLFGCSRKGFLKRPGETDISERDHLSAACGAFITQQIGERCPVYLRVHNVALQKKVLSEMNGSDALSVVRKEIEEHELSRPRH